MLLMHVIALLVAVTNSVTINYAWVEMMEAGPDPLVPHLHQWPKELILSSPPSITLYLISDLINSFIDGISIYTDHNIILLGLWLN